MDFFILVSACHILRRPRVRHLSLDQTLDECPTELKADQHEQGLASSKGDDFEANWQALSGSLKRIHTKDASDLSFEQLYRNAYNIIVTMRGHDLYERVKQLEREWLETEVRSWVDAAISPSLLFAQDALDIQDQANERRAAGERFLAVLRETWEDHQLSMGMITDVLMYMVRVSYPRPRRGFPLTFHLGRIA